MSESYGKDLSTLISFVNLPMSYSSLIVQPIYISVGINTLKIKKLGFLRHIIMVCMSVSRRKV